MVVERPERTHSTGGNGQRSITLLLRATSHAINNISIYHEEGWVSHAISFAYQGGFVYSIGRAYCLSAKVVFSTYSA